MRNARGALLGTTLVFAALPGCSTVASMNAGPLWLLTLLSASALLAATQRLP